MNLEDEANFGLAEACCEMPAMQSREAEANRSDFATALIDGLSARRKSIPCRFFYDAEGSRLFEAITELPEYYPTRTEIGILRANAGRLAEFASPGSVLIEFGSGSSTKTEILLDVMPRLHAYVPIDISPTALDDARSRIAGRYPDLPIIPIVGDFSQPLTLPPDIAGRPLVGFFPGSTIGNLTEKEAQALLASMQQILGHGARMIVGADLKKDPRRLIAAYDDAEGVTAAFNLNLLRRANLELGADFDLYAFNHLATYDRRQGRIDMHLVSRIDQVVSVLGQRFRFIAGERIHTEHSHKYDIEGFRDLARRAGWRSEDCWTDSECLFSVHILESR